MASPRSGGLLALLLVGALLLCHVALSFAHKTSCPAGCEASSILSPAHDGNGPGYAQSSIPTDGQLPAGNFALALFGAALLWLLLGARRRYETVTRILCLPRSLPAFVCLPREPSPPLLQVFRL